jgi:hypothetical protein
LLATALISATIRITPPLLLAPAGVAGALLNLSVGITLCSRSDTGLLCRPLLTKPLLFGRALALNLRLLLLATSLFGRNLVFLTLLLNSHFGVARLLRLSLSLLTLRCGSCFFTLCLRSRLGFHLRAPAIGFTPLLYALRLPGGDTLVTLLSCRRLVSITHLDGLRFLFVSLDLRLVLEFAFFNCQQLLTVFTHHLGFSLNLRLALARLLSSGFLTRLLILIQFSFVVRKLHRNVRH